MKNYSQGVQELMDVECGKSIVDQVINLIRRARYVAVSEGAALEDRLMLKKIKFRVRCWIKIAQADFCTISSSVMARCFQF